MAFSSRMLAAAALAISWGGSASPTGALDMKTQSVCDLEAPDSCLSFPPSGGPLTVRSIKFDMPGPGKAYVNFHGTMFCGQGSGTDKLVRLVSGITKDETTIPTLTEPGSLRLLFMLKDEPEHTLQASSQTENLASSRIIEYASGGAKRVYFRIMREQMDSFTTCRVHGAVFNVITTP